MAEDRHIIMGIHVDDRIKKATAIQEQLTAYGCHIKTRLGLHEVDGNFCAGYGLILLELVGGQKEADELAAKLNALEGVEVKLMTFDHT
ncbi:MAG: hypothetical protein BA869_07730 [Desulfuromonadales bacterium C00003107]|nr:MAG: hypothetical protein BA869_07730 [Desulfuromonadales bacterium C00003107]